MSWPRAGDELARVQDELAAAEPAAWHESAGSDVGACIVVFPRGKTGAGDAGDPAWAAAAVLRGRRVVADAVVTGQAGAPYAPGLLALREGPVLEAAVRALPAGTSSSPTPPAATPPAGPASPSISVPCSTCRRSGSPIARCSPRATGRRTSRAPGPRSCSRA